ncbi:MAG: iron-containing alcohol dehydrogenase [Myxococcota bacterium]|nr:iron-containing alcohol dehydrogenase [Myxococcota bacterium]
MKAFGFYLPTKIAFGRGQIRKLGALIDPAIRRVLVVTDEAIANQTTAVATVTRQLGQRSVLVYDAVEENPSFSTIEQCADQARQQGAELIIGLGGGSPMDVAKGTAVLATNGEKMSEYMSGRPIAASPLSIICIPTTSGTGSEVTPFAVFTDKKAQTKGGLAHSAIFPKVALVDPELTYTMPKAVVVNTGLDVLTHAVEAYLSKDASKMSDVFALEAIDIVLNQLPRAAVLDRSAMDFLSYAATLAGVAIAHAGTILLHVMGYPLTACHNIAHGRATAILLPAFMDFMRERSTARDKVTYLETAFARVGGIETFVQACGVSTRLSSYGVTTGDFDLFAEKTIVKSDIGITPAVVTKETIVEILRAAL